MRVFTVAALLSFALVAIAGCGEEDEGGGGSNGAAASERADREREREDEEPPPTESSTTEASECDPNYSGACLDPYASDYDCSGGSGDGPSYTGPVTVVGDDHYGFDADGDGSACE